ncbi:DUF4112 domain-containing protein [Roseofilum casamattae]|uniref:DUF4112 domain-containing protein n=1 Tax=Roseofilum casamattae BLCC-M143 TaxID=3022442 RepID=A0ABT7BYB3_9CYAN|nr:DUF4112 domain-containing protein [Roseofilum casamattae]MDJ1184165.1 DUF4112 domain-containing protein [Roseofilum casamattae BLCC-M143]
MTKRNLNLGQSEKNTRVERLRSLSNLLDNAIAIPGSNYRVGIDPLIGLLPGGGDFLSSALSAYIVIEATRFGLPKETLGRMVMNVLIDTFVGIIPVLGDLYDVTWKANSLNVQLLEDHLENPSSSKKADRGFVALIIITLVSIIIGITAFGVFMLWVLQIVLRGLF